MAIQSIVFFLRFSDLRNGESCEDESLYVTGVNIVGQPTQWCGGCPVFLDLICRLPHTSTSPPQLILREYRGILSSNLTITEAIDGEYR